MALLNEVDNKYVLRKTCGVGVDEISDHL
ncbi:MAG: hypothetical protein ACI9LX_004693, partial [Paraglaciecola sp.]